MFCDSEGHPSASPHMALYHLLHHLTTPKLLPNDADPRTAISTELFGCRFITPTKTLGSATYQSRRRGEEERRRGEERGRLEEKRGGEEEERRREGKTKGEERRRREEKRRGERTREEENRRGERRKGTYCMV